MARIRLVRACVLAVPLALFFAFVGWNKAFAPLAELARHGAWTIHIPAWLGRLVGFSELALALALAGALTMRWRRVGRIAALALVANQIVAGMVHLAHGEAGALPQNAVLTVMLLAVAALAPRATDKPKESA